jgi:hypothetical protein
MIARARALLMVAALAGTALAPRSRATTDDSFSTPSTQDTTTPRHPTLLAGAYWTHLSGAEKRVYLSGFLAGAAAEQARTAVAAVQPDDDTAAVAGAVESLRTRHALRFPFAPQVYVAQLDDFYWWSNHTTVPIVDALITVNAHNVHQ